ncbi:MAG: glutaredoxin 3 [Proteobacteria bacterium]|nr:glutaredoxin 3 [Pseudomonadota bacterium]
MPPVEIYTTPFCGYCHMAKRLLKGKGIAFSETNVLLNPSLRTAMMQRAGGRRSVPQIFIGQTHVGGCDELYALERAGKLDAMLAT